MTQSFMAWDELRKEVNILKAYKPVQTRIPTLQHRDYKPPSPTPSIASTANIQVIKEETDSVKMASPKDIKLVKDAISLTCSILPDTYIKPVITKRGADTGSIVLGDAFIATNIFFLTHTYFEILYMLKLAPLWDYQIVNRYQ